VKQLIKGLSTSLLLGTVSLTAVQAQGNIYCGIVNTEKTPLSIRASMSQDAKVIATASKGSALAYIDTDSELDTGFYKVILDDGKTGYASKQFVKNFIDAEAGCGLVETKDTTLNVREGMGKDTKVIGKVRKGAMLRLLDKEGEEGEWLRVQLNNGKMGYVRKDFVRIYSNSETSDMPMVTLSSANDWLATAQQEGFTVLLQKDFKQNQQNKRMVIQAKSTGDGHVSGATLRGAVLVKQGMTWQVESATADLGELGSWGQPPEAQLIKIGPDQYGVFFKSNGTGQGVSTENTSLVTAVGTKLKEVFSLETSENNGGVCESADCYDYETKLEFVPGRNPDYFDINAVTKGSLPGGKKKKPQRFSFTGEQYKAR